MELSNPTTNDIEVRICGTDTPDKEDMLCIAEPHISIHVLSHDIPWSQKEDSWMIQQTWGTAQTGHDLTRVINNLHNNKM